MSSRRKPILKRVLQRVQFGLAAFFKYDIGVQRGSDGVRVVLQAAPPKLTKALSREQEGARREKEELAVMRRELAELLDELPETRQTMRHLVFVEHALAKRGLRALHKLPVEALEKALEQLEALVTNWSPVGLASLRSKMAVAIIDREHHNPEAEADAYRTAAVMESLPPQAPAPEAPRESEDDALAAAYAALGHLAPGVVEMQGELHSPSARVIEREAARPRAPATSAPDSIQLRTLQP